MVEVEERLLPLVRPVLPRVQHGQLVLLLSSKTTVDGDCSHEIRRSLLLGSKAMAKINNALRRRNIILPNRLVEVSAFLFYS